ncbi:unnamed protein product [Gordionus sp. m RMFG-2023]|uniref:mitochondrial Rho GTPase 1-A-like isoform X2 n=1 Tax=Gordionus sp. m RMFG-2023 TaxID=3053472 RepID=UPI0030E5F258
MKIFSKRKKDVRILVLGEDGVGKTSIILSLVTDEFAIEVPPRAEEITIPADVTPDRVPTYIVDFSTQEQSEDVLIEEIQKADVICLVYAINDDSSIEQLKNYWLPIIRRVLGEHGIPIILVGNKYDEMSQSSMEKIVPLMNTFPEIETCIECSAKCLKNLSEVFYYAQKAVLYPTSSIYQPFDKELTPKCVQALTRIFKIFDKDNDALLNDEEINDFQDYCFNIPLQDESLDEIKNIIRKNINDGIFDNSLTLNGFVFLHKLFIQRGRHETTWAVLRKFGYDDELNLYRLYLNPNFKVPYGCTAELTDQGNAFLNCLFRKYDEDLDGALSPSELVNYFSVYGDQNFMAHDHDDMGDFENIGGDSSFDMLPANFSDFKETFWGPSMYQAVEVNDKSWLTKEGYMAYWNLIILLDQQKAFEYLAYLGYPINDEDNQTSSVQITQSVKMGRSKKFLPRSVYHCDVIGSDGVGKTTFLQGMLGKNLESIKSSNTCKYSIKRFKLYSYQKYLALHEVHLSTLEKSDGKKHYCDCVCMVYDTQNPRSFFACARTYKKYYLANKIPALIFGMNLSSQSSQPKENYLTNQKLPNNESSSPEIDTEKIYGDATSFQNLGPVQFASKYRLNPPMILSGPPPTFGYNGDLYLKILKLAAYPNLKLYHQEKSNYWLKLSIGTACITIFALIVFKFWKTK